MRGKVRVGEAYSRAYRITPAYAGKSFTWVPLPFFAEDHPRLCGEKANHRAFRRQFAGSPPPMRGKVKKAAWYLNKFRITPAYAGKSLVVKSKVLVPRDHPRLCGEKFRGQRGSKIYNGSPPPMRGKGRNSKI